MSSLHVFFFFQAEDGIRDTSVTGVQTCALPICEVRAFDAHTGALKWTFDPIPQDSTDPAYKTWQAGSAKRTGPANRSEERAVGKEGRARWLPGECKSKEDRRLVTDEREVA